jgi:hypothetical protein
MNMTFFPSTKLTKAADQFTTSALLVDAAERVLEISTHNHDGSHPEINDAVIYEFTDYRGYGRYTKNKALQAINLVMFDLQGRQVDHGKRYSQSMNEFAVTTVRRNAEARAYALLLAAEVAKERFVKPLELATVSARKVAEQLDVKSDKLMKTKRALAETKGLLKKAA